MYTIKETIASIREEIAEKEKEIELIENIDKIDFTWENYNRLCHTNISTDVLVAKLTERFPFLRYSRCNGGSLDFKINSSTELINGIIVRIPKYDLPEIAIFVPKPRDTRKSLYRDIDYCEKEIERYRLLANADFKTRVEHGTAGIKKGFRTIAYLMHGGDRHFQEIIYHKINTLEDRIERNKEQIKTITDLLDKYGMRIQHLYHYAFPLFFEWCERICVNHNINIGGTRVDFCKKDYKYR
jgi:hypothetical protein